jgi:hypothetical protein
MEHDTLLAARAHAAPSLFFLAKEHDMSRCWRVMLVCAALAGGCSGGKNFPCSEMAEVVCHNLFKCCTGAAIERALGTKMTTTQETCRRDMELICRKNNHRLLTAVAKGKAKTAKETAVACIKSFRVQGDECFTMAAKPPWEEACKEPMGIGQVAVGAACDSSIECVKDSYCAPDRKCKAYGKDAQSCASLQCAEGLYCSAKDRRCAALGKEGATCTASYECAKEHFCDRKPLATDGSCKRKRGPGTPCTGEQECLGTCIPGICSGSQRTCHRDDECGGTCEGSTMTCRADRDCGGRCALSGASCYSACYGRPGDLCVFKKCQLASCEGQRVCGESLSLVDYCEDAVALVGRTGGSRPASAEPREPAPVRRW